MPSRRVPVVFALLVTIVSAGAARSGAMVQEPKPTPQPEQQQPMAKPPADMSAKCKEMMAQHEKAMAAVKDADTRLDALVAKMNAAQGEAKAEATAAVVNEMVTQRKMLRERMMMMQEQAMRHMMEHMQAGPESMASCPMMKGMGAK